MRQGHPEVNFRMGKGRRREQQKAFSRGSLEATCKFLGMTNEATNQFLAETDVIRAGITLTCVDCGGSLPSPTPDPFRCERCRRARGGPAKG